MKLANPIHDPNHQNDPRLASTGHSSPPDPVPAYWNELAAAGTPEFIIGEFSAEVHWSFPRTHLSRFEVDAVEDWARLRFPLATLHIKAGSPWQREALIDDILNGKCSVLVALAGEAPGGRFSHEALPHPINAGGQPISQVAFVRQMLMTVHFPLSHGQLRE